MTYGMVKVNTGMVCMSERYDIHQCERAALDDAIYDAAVRGVGRVAVHSAEKQPTLRRYDVEIDYYRSGYDVDGERYLYGGTLLSCEQGVSHRCARDGGATALRDGDYDRSTFWSCRVDAVTVTSWATLDAFRAAIDRLKRRDDR